MASGALFGGSSTRSQSKYLVEFKAGKMTMKGKMVHPDKRKGMVYVYQSDDSLMHFCWKDRTRNVVEDDLIIFPDDCEFKRVAQCTTGRVYLLRFKSTARKMFFWMQEPKTDKDEDNAKKINENLNNPPTPGQSRAGGAGTGGASGAGGLGGLPPELASGLGGDSDLNSLLGNMSQQQLMQLLGGMGMGGGLGGLGGLSNLVGGGRPGSAQSESAPPSRVQSSPGPRGTQRGGASDVSPSTLPPRPVTAAELPSQTPSQSSQQAATGGTAGNKDSGQDASASDSDARIQLRDLQTILSGMGGGGEKESVDLASVITPESMVPILANKDVQERLIPHLPEGSSLPKTEEELRNTISTPQFQQAMQSFSAALVSGQLGPLMGQFELGEDVANAAAAGDVEGFAKAMQEAEKKRKESGE